MSSDTPSLRKVLVVDDEADHADMLCQFLESYRFNAEASTLPETALTLLAENKYDLIITDYKMPGMDGLEFVERARALYPDIPVIIISGAMNMPELLEVANKHVNYVLKKPVEIEELISIVRRYVEPVPDDVPMSVCRLDDASFKGLRPFQYFAGASFGSRCFFKNLTEALHQTRTLFIESYPGVERYLVMKEVGYQMGNVDIDNFPRIRAGDLDKSSVQTLLGDYIAKRENFPFVCVEGIRVCSKEDLLFLDHFLNERPDPFKELHFIYWIETEYLAENYNQMPKTLLSRLKHFQVFLPRLAERLPDIASYASTFFEEKQVPVVWTPEAIGFLLNNPWRSNYDELIDVLEKWSQEGLPKESSYGRASLEDALLSKQRKCVELEMALSKIPLVDALQNLGVSESVRSKFNDVDDLKLIYPELLKAQPQ